MKRKSPKYKHIIELVLFIAAILVINLVAGFKFFRLDMTEEKIHTLNDKTKEYLSEEVDDVINVVIYLNGNELPPIIQKFRQAIKDKLDEFKAYAGNNIKYTYVDINEDPKLTKKYKQTFNEKGVSGNIIQHQEKGAAKMVEFYPIVEVRQGSNSKFIDFMGDMVDVSPYYVDQKLNTIEYEFLSAFNTISGKPKPTVSLLRGHGELKNIETISVYNQLKNFYILDTVRIIKQPKDSLQAPKEDLNALDKTDVLIVAKPQKPFTEKELFILDQFIMKGGKIIWSIDMIDDHEDSLAIPGTFYTFSETNDYLDNLEKMLYKYGAGIKKNFVSNQVCAPQYRYDMREESYWNPYYYDNFKNKKPIEPIIKQWYPFPCVTKEGSELTKNIGRVKLKYPSIININNGTNVSKTVLLETDYEYKEWPAITRIRYDERIVFEDLASVEPSGTYFKPKINQEVPTVKQPLAVLLEGEFSTNFPKSLFSPEFLKGMEDANFKYYDKSKKTSMIVIGDGDFLRNDILFSKQGVQPINLGLDYMVSREMIYANAVFLHNCIDHITGNDYLIPLRSRVNMPRFLNSDEILNNRAKWQGINLIIPSIFVLILGLSQWFIRRRKYVK